MKVQKAYTIVAENSRERMLLSTLIGEINNRDVFSAVYGTSSIYVFRGDLGVLSKKIETGIEEHKQIMDHLTKLKACGA